MAKLKLKLRQQRPRPRQPRPMTTAQEDQAVVEQAMKATRSQ